MFRDKIKALKKDVTVAGEAINKKLAEARKRQKLAMWKRRKN